MGKIIMYLDKKIGDHIQRFAVEGETLYDVVMESKKMSFDDVHQCGVCGAVNLELSAHHTGDGYDYVYVKCKKCRATLNFGQQKKNKEVFYLKTIDITEGQYKGGKSYDWKPFIPEQK